MKKILSTCFALVFTLAFQLALAECLEPVKTSEEYLACAGENKLNQELSDRLKQQQQNNPAKKSSGPDGCTAAGNFTQAPDPSSGAVSQIFGDYPDFDSVVADDFITPQPVSCAEATIYLTSIAFEFSNVSGSFTGCADVQITIYSDGGGMPSGTIIAQETTPVDPHVGAFAVYNFTTCPQLMPGTIFWVEIVAIGDFGICGQEFLELSSTEAGTTSAVFQNPGNGFGTGCTAWTDMVTCLGADFPNLAMDLTFCEDESVCTEPPTDDIPTLSQWGLITLMLTLMNFGAIKLSSVGAAASATIRRKEEE